jgi:glycosyltransferase involved in cell wall biosynthesis
VNVVFYGSFLYPNGYAATKRKQQFIDYLVAHGSCVRVILSEKRARGHNENPFNGSHNGVPYEVVNKYTSSKILSLAIYPLITAKIICRFKRYHKQNDCNIVVNFGISTVRSLLVNVCCKRLGYHIFNDVVEDFSSKGLPLNKRIRYMIWGECISRLASRYLVSSTSVISSLLFEKYSAYIGDVSKIKLIPISAGNLSRYDETPTHSSDSFIFQYSGTYGDKERLDIVVTALNAINQIGKPICLRLTGDCPQHVREMIQRLSSGVLIEYTGKLSDSDYYQSLLQANVLLMVRSGTLFANTGFPYKLGEYLATANPVICTRVSDVDKYLDDNSAVLIPPDDYGSMLRALTEVYNNYGDYIETGKKGKAICEKHFNPEENSKQFYKMLATTSS